VVIAVDPDAVSSTLGEIVRNRAKDDLNGLAFIGQTAAQAIVAHYAVPGS